MVIRESHGQLHENACWTVIEGLISVFLECPFGLMLLTYRDLLRDIFFCITFQWTARRLPVLQLVNMVAPCDLAVTQERSFDFRSLIPQQWSLQVLHTIQDYPTNTTVCLITNEPERLRTVLKHWNFDRVTVCGEERTLGHAFQLAWVHREVMETVFQRGQAFHVSTLHSKISVGQEMRHLPT